MWLLGALACTSPPAGSPDGPPEPDRTGSTGLPASTGDTSGAEVPWIGDALADRCPDPTPRRWSAEGDDLRLATLSDAAARCNDGSPPVAWVRAGESAHAAEWVIHLDGGSFCADAESCAVRWCGEEFYDASKMSSRWAEPSRRGDGILSQDPANDFRGWNHVFVHYCSSDLWTGTRADHVWDGPPAFRVDNQGHGIVDAVVDALLAGLTSDDGVMVLPPLDQAETLVFGGSSAGGYGAAIHLDHVAGRVPGARVLGLPDAIFARPTDLLPPDQGAALLADVQRLWEEVVQPAWGGFTDQSCLAAHPTEEWRCGDLDPILRGQVTVPWLMHHDLRDPVLYPFFGDAGLTEAEFAQLGEGGLRTFAAEQPLASVHGTTCGEHTALDADGSFLQMSVVDAVAGGPAVTLHDAVRALVEGRRVLAVDAAMGGGSVCNLGP